MRMDSSIILSGRQPDVMGNMLRGYQFGRQDRLNTLYDEHGPGIASGDQAAMNVLAQFDPTMSLDVQDKRQTMDARDLSMQNTRQIMDQRSAQMARAAESWAKSLSADEAAQKHQAWEQGLRRGIQFYQAGDLTGLNNLLTGFGEEPLSSLEEFPGVAAQADSVISALKAVADLSNGPKPSAAEAEIRRTMSAWNVDYQTAQGIADGVIRVSRHPVDGSPMFTNMATGEAWEPTMRSAQPTQPPAQPVQDAQPEVVDGLSDSFGLEGAAKRFANTIAGTVGEVAYPDVQSAQSELNVMGEAVTRNIMNAYRRQPPRFIAEAIRSLFPEGGRPLLGSPEALSKLTAIRNQLERDQQRLDQSLKRRLRPTDRQALEEQNVSAKQGIDALDTLIRSLGSNASQGQNTTSGGVQWRVVE